MGKSEEWRLLFFCSLQIWKKSSKFAETLRIFYARTLVLQNPKTTMSDAKAIFNDTLKTYRMLSRCLEPWCNHHCHFEDAVALVQRKKSVRLTADRRGMMLALLEDSNHTPASAGVEVAENCILAMALDSDNEEDTVIIICRFEQVCSCSCNLQSRWANLQHCENACFQEHLRWQCFWSAILSCGMFWRLTWSRQ